MSTHDAARPDAPRPGTAGPQPGPGVGLPPSAWPTGRLLSAAARRVERSWDTYLERWSLTHASLPLLAVLAGGPRSQREIAADLGVTEQSVSRMALGLERAGYLHRRRHGEDRRRQVVAVTDAGRAALAALDDPGAVEDLATGSLTDAERAELRRLLLRVVEAQAEETAAAPGPRRPQGGG